MKYLILPLIFALTACSSNKKLEIEILSNQINCLKTQKNEYIKYLDDSKSAPENSVTILSYKLTNNTDETYYFNLDWFENQNKLDFIKVDRAYLNITDVKGVQIKPTASFPTKGLDADFFYSNYLGYNYIAYDTRKNFVIHPHETLYFEWFIILPFGNMVENSVYWVNLDYNKKYEAELLLISDSTNFKKYISKADLKMIEKNKYKIFNGTIKSKNKIPIVFKD